MKSIQVVDFIDSVLKKVSLDLTKRFPLSPISNWKKDRSRATDADAAAEGAIVSAIKKNFPLDGILSEECGFIEAEILRGGENTKMWVVDPLDGTANFFHKIPYFAVSIARCERLGNNPSKTIESGIAYPIMNRNYLASRQEGKVWANGRVLPSLNEALGEDLTHGFFACGLACHEDKAIYARDLEIYSRLNCYSEAIRRLGASALDLALVADGVLSGFWQRRLEPWDMAAAVLMIELVGGKVSNYPSPNCKTSSHFDLLGQGVVAGHPKTVDFILSQIAEVDKISTSK